MSLASLLGETPSPVNCFKRSPAWRKEDPFHDLLLVKLNQRLSLLLGQGTGKGKVRNLRLTAVA